MSSFIRRSSRYGRYKMAKNLVNSEESSALLENDNSKKPTVFVSLSQSFSDDYDPTTDVGGAINPVIDDNSVSEVNILTSSVSSVDSNDFVKLEADYGNDDYSATLDKCKKYIVNPYNVLLKIVGWRRLCSSSSESCSRYFTVLNYLYPAIIFTMIIVASIAQVTSCFDRSKSLIHNPENPVIVCENHLLTFEVLSYLLMLIAYVLALYTFRVQEPEHLSSLTESVFLSFHDANHTRSRRKPFFVLLAILSAGMLYFIVSLVISVIRMFALNLETPSTIIGWFTTNVTAENQSDYLKLSRTGYEAAHYSLLGLSFFGFLFFDLLYIAVMINYCSQCQLLTFYIDNLIDKVQSKKYDNLNQAMKEIHKVYGFLETLNSRMSLIASLIFFILLSNLIFSYKDFTHHNQHWLNVVAGFLNTTQWLLTVIFPVLLAARLTASGNQLRRLGQEIAVRPFCYSDTPDLELQFFLVFTESTKYEVNLAFIPMQPSLVFGFCFVLLLFFASGIVIGQVDSVTWF